MTEGGFKPVTLRDEIQPRGSGLNTWEKLWRQRQSYDVVACPQRNGEWVCGWSLKYRKNGAVWCHGRYYRSGCSVWIRVQANDGDPTILITDEFNPPTLKKQE